MRRPLAITAILVLLAAMPLAQVKAQTNPGQQGTLIVCPEKVIVAIRQDSIPQGWISQTVVDEAFFWRADILGASSGYPVRTLACSYSIRGEKEEGRLGRTEPTGVHCSVNLAKRRQFDCYADNNRNEMLGQAAQPSPSSIAGSGLSGGGAPQSGIGVLSATYGGNCGRPEGNVTAHLAGACNGKSSCGYSVDYKVIGDPAPGCKKDYVAKWKCGGGSEQTTRAEAEAGFGTQLSLICQ